MNCLICNRKTKVIDTRLVLFGKYPRQRRRRECLFCGERFTTYELEQTDMHVLARQSSVEMKKELITITNQEIEDTERLTKDMLVQIKESKARTIKMLHEIDKEKKDIQDIYRQVKQGSQSVLLKVTLPEEESPQDIYKLSNYEISDSVLLKKYGMSGLKERELTIVIDRIEKRERIRQAKKAARKK